MPANKSKVVKSPSVRNTAKVVGGRSCIISDNGEGIPDEHLARIFNVFESSKGNRGTGLGLSVSQKILQEHGGEIRVSSQPGQGSTFTLDLPAIQPESPRLAEPQHTLRTAEFDVSSGD